MSRTRVFTATAALVCVVCGIVALRRLYSQKALHIKTLRLKQWHIDWRLIRLDKRSAPMFKDVRSKK